MTAVLHRVVVSVESATVAQRFYHDVLGLRIKTGAGLTCLSDGVVELLLHERPSQPSDLSVALSFRVEDLEQTCSRWQDSGGTVVDPPRQQPWGEKLAMVRDADGHLVCLTQ